MRNFIKKFIKPSLEEIGIYKYFYKTYFFILDRKIYLVNIFLKHFTKTAPILIYHRIASAHKDPLMLCVSTDCFELHLKLLSEKYNIIPLLELSNKIINKKLNGDEVSITFDDGYQDNLLNALPLLEKYNAPATIFVTTGSIGQKASFEWDMEYEESDRATFLNKDEIKKLAEHPLITIGAHTHTHPRLSDLSFEDQKDNILKSKNLLEEMTGTEIKTFAYPFGGKLDFNKSSEKAVAELNFDVAFSNNGAIANNFSKKFSIPRINIREYSAKELSKKI